jgi:hypothetical protein
MRLAREVYSPLSVMTPNVAENVVENRTAPAPKSATPVAPTPRPAPKAEHYWFVFDRWLPSASAPEDEFVLA